MQNKYLVISDIDGTLIPHPWFSGLSAAERASAVQRLAALSAKPNFWLITGRRQWGFDRLFNDAKLATPIFPVVALEFGSLLYCKNELVYKKSRNQKLYDFLTVLNDKISAIPELNLNRNIDEEITQGKMQSWYIELKEVLGQIECQFSDNNLANLYWNSVYAEINPFLQQNPEFYVQYFQGRIDVIDRNFTPKELPWFLLEEMGATKNLVPANELTVVILGDEYYDAALFQSYLNYKNILFKDVITVSVGHKLPHSNLHLPNTQTALDYVEKLIC